jgi:hypothetical protein
MPLAGGDLLIIQLKLGLVGALEGVLEGVLDRAHASLPAASSCLRLLSAACGCFRVFATRLNACVWRRPSRWRLRSASC